MQKRDSHFQSQCLVYVALAVGTLLLYLKALHFNFVEYDDQQYVTDNPHVQSGLTLNGLVWAFGFHAGNWHPLAWLSHMLDCQLFGARPGGHHFTSILLHTATTLLLFNVLFRMTRQLWRSAAVAALFAWHPLHVESVAWVAERKDTLCAFFWMLTLLAYARYAERNKSPIPQPDMDVRFSNPSPASCFSSPDYWLSFLFFALCLMAKPMAVTLPFVLLLLDFWPLNRMGILNFRFQVFRTLLVEKIPFLLLVIAGCALTLHAQQIAIVSTAGLTIPQRIAHVLVAYNHYLGAMFFPYHLAVYYPYVLDLPSSMVLLAGGVIGIITTLAIANIRRRPYLLAGWLWYLGTLVPVIGLVQVGDQAWADRYTYLPLIGPFMAVIWLAAETFKNRAALCALALVMCISMLAATSLQLNYWKNTWTLFDHANKVTHENYMAITVLASQLAKQGKLDEAMELYHTALAYKPTFPEAHFFLGNAFDQAGRLDEAVLEYKKALWFKPTQEQTHIFLGIVLGKQKKYDEAIANYQAALVLNPDSAPAHNNLARIYHTQGRFAEAMEQYSAALKIDPKLALAHNNLGILLLQQGSLNDGVLQLRQALQLNPTNSETQFNLALALNQQQQWIEATGLFLKTVGAGTKDPKAHYEFATALAHTQKTREAMSEFATALLLQPDYPDALNGLAWILSTTTQPAFRNGPEAVKMAERACTLTENKDPAKLRTLAAAYAESGQFPEATNTIGIAKDLAGKMNQSELVNQCSLMLDRFKHSESWRDP